MSAQPTDAPSPVLEVDGLTVAFRRRGRLLGAGDDFRAVDGVSLRVVAGETLAIVGESGSGKSTTARAMLRLVAPRAGRVLVNGVDLGSLRGGALRSKRREIQMVFQDPLASLDPRMRVAAAVAEPLVVHEGLDRTTARARAAAALAQVGLSASVMDRLPRQLSGGQRQRVAIARAIVVRPSVVVFDEAVSALDVSTRNQIINLLEELQRDLGIAYVFIAHDLALVRHIAHRVAVMYRGRVVEDGPAARVFGEPAHPYTRALIEATPLPDPAVELPRRARRRSAEGAPPELGAAPTGCAYRLRCPWAVDVCTSTVPPLLPVDAGGTVACVRHPL